MDIIIKKKEKFFSFEPHFLMQTMYGFQHTMSIQSPTSAPMTSEMKKTGSVYLFTPNITMPVDLDT